MDKSNRPMFVIRKTKTIHLNENETSSSTLADIDGADEVFAEKNKAGEPAKNLIDKKEKPITIWRKIINFILENIKSIIIGIITAVVLTSLGFS
ncbi:MULTISPECIES: hypothetical protein [unclassified Citrobacter]|uniref:hypothetical protein n=1 Tax=unclassified Citrobacter TaxID=2644389 RepID=UPI002574ADDE|nr:MULTISPECIES: hypothetical protein [unclassified Citrobacter]MDM2798206.1 hypothetical protein [Citrobacter sp. Cpo131]MDM2891530.1 hypothetical protein [Citrobacter sp. Cpo060]